MACDNSGDDNAGALHAHDPSGVQPEQTKDVRGCGLAIAYNSDVRAIKPEDFAVVSVNYHCPWHRDVDFQIPEGLPECPPGGCHCMWGWIHSSGGGGQEMYFNGYRCNVTGKTGTVPIPKPVVARKCPFDKNNCTVGAKQPHYWLQAEGNNNFQDWYDPPFYNGDYGWSNGAQTDLWEIDHGSTWITNASEWAPAAPMVGENTGGVYVARKSDDLSSGSELPPVPTGDVGNNRVAVEGAGSKSSSVAEATPAPAKSTASSESESSTSPRNSGSQATPTPSGSSRSAAPSSNPKSASSSAGDAASSSSKPMPPASANASSAANEASNSPSPLPSGKPSANATVSEDATSNSTVPLPSAGSSTNTTSPKAGSSNSTAPSSSSSPDSTPSVNVMAPLPSIAAGSNTTSNSTSKGGKKCKRGRKRSHRLRL